MINESYLVKLLNQCRLMDIVYINKISKHCKIYQIRYTEIISCNRLNLYPSFIVNNAN